MHIRGTDNPSCGLCANMSKTANGEKLLCKLSGDETLSESSCAKFRYDIFKYKGTDKAKIGKFRKEDFEL